MSAAAASNAALREVLLAWDDGATALLDAAVERLSTSVLEASFMTAAAAPPLPPPSPSLLSPADVAALGRYAASSGKLRRECAEPFAMLTARARQAVADAMQRPMPPA